MSHHSGTSMKPKSHESGGGGAHCLWHKGLLAVAVSVWVPPSTAPLLMAISNRVGFSFGSNKTWTLLARSVGNGALQPLSPWAIYNLWQAPRGRGGGSRSVGKAPARGPSLWVQNKSLFQ